MAITGIDTIEGKQIIAAGAVSAKSAEMAYNDENGNPITGYLTAVPEGYATTADLTGKQDTLTFGYNESNAISSINESAIAAGSTLTYGYTDNGLISAIDASGLYALSAASALHLRRDATMGENILQYNSNSNFYYMPMLSPFGKPQGIYSPLQYATGACLAMSGGNFGAYYKGNEWYISNTAIGQMLRGEVHNSRGVHISGATTAGYGFDLNIKAVSGVNSTGSWKYGYQEDAALRAVSSCDMHESAFEYDANDKISGYNGSAFAGGSDVPEGVMVESGLEYNAVNEISGYNGSAIAQYGAEKQWLVHDDTLVHASNSAQYALGVNVSAVQTLMGLDETVLWSGARQTTGTIQLSESMWSYNTMDIYVCPDYNTYSTRMGYQITRLTVIPQIDNNEQLLCYVKSNRIASNTYLSELFYLRFNPDGSSVDFSPGIKWSNNTVTTGVTAFTGAVTKIVGIGRKQ